MFTNFDYIAILIICYLVGSIPFGLLISISLNKDDPRQSGSKNIGATNIVRTSGWKLGLLTLICDIFKGYVPLLVFSESIASIEFMILFLFLGHLFPIWIKFNGGKGIAVIIGSLAAYNSAICLIFVLIWIFIATVTKYSSLSALMSSIGVLVIFYFQDDLLFPVMSIIVFLIFFKHIPNIKRLLSGKESKIILKNKN